MARRAYIAPLAMLFVAVACARKPGAADISVDAGGKPQSEDAPDNKKTVVDIPVDKLNAGYQLLGKTGRPLGTVVTIQGVIGRGDRKGYEGVKRLRIERVDNLASQEGSEITLKAYQGEFGDETLPKLIVGKSYEFTGYESGGYVGTPGEAYQRAGKLAVQTTGFYFHTEFICLSGKLIQ